MPIIAAGKVAVVTVNAGGAATVRVMLWLLTDSPAASVTLKVNWPLPPPVGMPLMTPVLLFKLNPAGSVAGVTVQV